jgi:hypothetical protein
MALVLRPPDSRESLPETLADLGRSRKAVSVASGMFAFLAALVGGVLLACVLDSVYHLSPVARGFALVSVLALAGVVWARGVRRALALPTEPIAVAMELEEKYPGLNDALGSAVSFLEAGDAEERGLSHRLQEQAVRAARRAAGRHDFDRIVPTGRCWRNAWLCVAAVGAAVPLGLVDTERANVALARLADPFGEHPWPTKTRVEVLSPEVFPFRMPRGEPFDLKFVVRGVVKERAAVAFRTASGEEFEEQYPLAAGNDPKFPGAAVVTARIEAARILTPFDFKIATNDFESGWMRVQVVPPPRLVPLPGSGPGRTSPEFHVTPPAYTGLPAQDLPDGASAIEIPVGSVVRVRAATDVPLASAVLAFTGDRSAVTATSDLAALGHLNPLAAVGAPRLAEAIGSDIPMSLSETRREFSGEFVPSMSGMYAFRVTDETGLTGSRLLEIRLIPDPPPTVTLLRPALGKDPAILTPSGVIPVHVAADDKTYAVRRSFLEYRVGRDGQVRSIPLRDARAAEFALPAVVGGPGAPARVRPLSADAQFLLPLSALTRDGVNPLRDGDVLFVRGAADDWDDVTPAKEPGRSGEVEILIASPESIEAWLERELAALRPDLTRTRNQQREARQNAGEVKPQPDGTLLPDDRDRLLASEQAQRLIRGKVADPRDGLRAKADVLLETVRANNLPRSNTTDRVRAAADILGRVADRDLPVIEPTLAEARQIGAQPPGVGEQAAVPEMLKRAGRHQKAVEDGLTDLLDLLSVWGGAVEIRGEARVLRDFVQRQAGDIEKMDPKATPGDLDRAGTRAEQASDQANQLIGRATRLAGQKDDDAAKLRAGAGDKAKDAAAMRAKAAELPPGTPEKSTLNAQAALADGLAADLKAAADKAAAEATALRNAIKAAGGQNLPDDLRAAAAAARKDQRFDATGRLNSAAARLDKMIDTLTEKPPETAPDLVKLKKAANDIDDLAGAQDDLRHRAAEAGKITDPARRAAELKKLAAEQDKLTERGRELLQRLTREGAESSARDVRAAIDQMEAARADLENGDPGIPPQNEAVRRLDNARDRLDRATAAAPERLADEQRRKMAEKVKAVLDRQKAAAAEADRIHKLVAGNKGWQREYEASYFDVADQRESKIAEEVAALQKDFAELPVLSRVLGEATKAMNSAAEKITARLKEIDPALAFDPELEAANDRRVKRPMDLATRRLEQLLEALKQDEPKAGPKKEPPKGGGSPSGGGGNSDFVPPLAQVKVLRALQAELNQQTTEFAKLHPDPDKLTEEERAELKELEDGQREIAELFEHMAKLFREQHQPAGDKPEKAEKAEKQDKPAEGKP